MDFLADFFRHLAEDHPRWNFIWMYEPVQQGKILSGIWMTIKLSLACLALSMVIGVVGAFAQGSRNRILRSVVQGYIQFFRNTPPYVQLLFFYFALGQFTPTYSPDGWLEIPIISNVGWAIISLSFFAGAFNVEIFRAGIEAVPESTREAAEIARVFARSDLPLCCPAAGIAGIASGAEQQPCQSGEDDDTGLRHRRAGTSLPVGDNLERLPVGALPDNASCLCRLCHSCRYSCHEHEPLGKQHEDPRLWRVGS